MKLLSDIFTGGHESFVAAAFASAIAMIGAELLLLLRRRSRRTREPRA